jgi:hypothetical protein
MQSKDVDPIDNLIDQIDQIEQDNEGTNNMCVKCLCISDYLYAISCGHTICLECIETLIGENNYQKCPICKNVLTNNLQKIYSEFLADQVAKLAYYHDIHIGDYLWSYGGNGHNWLYSKAHCIQLTTALQNYNNSNDSNDQSSSDNTDSQTELQLQIGNNIETYIVDVDVLVQYPKNHPNKRRDVQHFKFKSNSTLKKYKIIGVAGKLL